MEADVLTRPKSKRSSERDALATAIEARDAAAERLRVAKEAHAEIERRYEGTRSKYYAVDTALDEAKAFLADTLRTHGGDEAESVAHSLKIGRDPPREAVERAEKTSCERRRRMSSACRGAIPLRAPSSLPRMAWGTPNEK